MSRIKMGVPAVYSSLGRRLVSLNRNPQSYVQKLEHNHLEQIVPLVIFHLHDTIYRFNIRLLAPMLNHLHA